MRRQDTGGAVLRMRIVFVAESPLVEWSDLLHACRRAITRLARKRGVAVRIERLPEGSGLSPAVPIGVEQLFRAKMLSGVLQVPEENVAQALASEADEGLWEDVLRTSDEERPKGHGDTPVLT